MVIKARIITEAIIDESEVAEITVKKLCKTYKLHPEQYIDRDGNLCRDWEYSAGSHSRDEKEVIRKATETEKVILAAIKEIKKECSITADFKRL